MARKEKVFTVETKGRDEGKAFLIKEMSADKAEWWAIRAGMAMARNGIEVPDDFAQMGMVALAQLGLSLVAKIPLDEAKPLLDELMACVSIIPDPGNPSITRADINSDIEEFTTRLKLRAEVLKLHVDFIIAVAG